MTALPLLVASDPDAIVAWADREPVTARLFLRDAAALAERLPEAGFMLNLCTDRYRFTVGLAAALLRGQITLLPPDHTPALVARLKASYSGVYGLVDQGSAAVDLVQLDFPERAGFAGATDPNIPAFPSGQVAAHVFTSGSTGTPQSHAKTWGSLVRGSLAAGLALDIARLPRASLLATVPAQHMYGLESSVMLALQHGLALESSRPLFPADVVARLAALPRPRVLVTTPVHLRALLSESGELPRADLVLCATAPLAPDLAARAESGFGASLIEIYGCTEAGQIATRRTIEGAPWTPLAGIALEAGAAGVTVAGNSVETATVLQDEIELEESGRFLLHGRNADLVNVAGKRTSLAHLNYQLQSIPGVQDGLFVNPAETEGPVARLLAFVVAPELSEEELLLALRLRIDSAFLPRPLYRVAALPRNATGKLPQADLARLLAASRAPQP